MGRGGMGPSTRQAKTMRHGRIAGRCLGRILALATASRRLALTFVFASHLKKDE
jgi:hypothetical protein